MRRAGAAGEIVMRFDSGFWSNDTIATLARHGVRYTMAVRTNTKGVAEVIAGIDETAWVDIDYTARRPSPSGRDRLRGRRLIVRRTRLTDPRQARLWPDWRHFAFFTDLDGDAAEIDAFHRAHASVELAIRDLKEGAGLEHCPSGNFSANSAWLQCAVLAHNLIRWTATIAETGPIEAAHRRPHRPLPTARHPRPSRQPLRHPHPQSPSPLAMGRHSSLDASTPSEPCPLQAETSAAWRPATLTALTTQPPPHSLTVHAPKADQHPPAIPSRPRRKSPDPLIANRWIEAKVVPLIHEE